MSETAPDWEYVILLESGRIDGRIRAIREGKLFCDRYNFSIQHSGYPKLGDSLTLAQADRQASFDLLISRLKADFEAGKPHGRERHPMLDDDYADMQTVGYWYDVFEERRSETSRCPGILRRIDSVGNILIILN